VRVLPSQRAAGSVQQIIEVRTHKHRVCLLFLSPDQLL
jgi:hypothetical protein